MTQAISRNNHYVPAWYQRRFHTPRESSLFFLDMKPSFVVASTGKSIEFDPITQRPPARCFLAKDLYTTRFGNQLNDDVERMLFGAIDNDGAKAVRAFANGEDREIHEYFRKLFEYLSAQKLRTPKGLDWIKDKYPKLTQIALMAEMQHLLQLNITMWVEGVREIVSAENSDVKFIVTDHPVTAYNAACPPNARMCAYPNDPATSLNGTQILFPLDANHCLILTHLDYAKDPSQLDLLANRQNARHMADTITRTDAMIRGRKVKREDVIAINHVMKSRARKYIAASNKEWLFPEETFAGAWREIGDVLRPQGEGMWRFGGEIYVGYKDGSTEYQDPYGRRSGSHEYLRKDVRADSVGPEDPCGCGNGRIFKDCCSGVPEHRRPSWSVCSIRERNLMFFRAVCDILGLDEGKSWNDVRAELSNEQVARIHEVFGALWPTDTNLAELLPRPDSRVFRTVYMGITDPRTALLSVASWTLYFDEIVVLHPFPNPNTMRPEYSPLVHPEAFKSQTLKNLSLLMSLMPFIEAGVVHLVPDPCELNPTLGKSVRDMAQQRCENMATTAEERELFDQLNRDDFQRQLARLPEKDLRRYVSRANPLLSSDDVARVIAGIKEDQLKDPFALLQPLVAGEENGELLVSRAMSLELALLLSQLTGSAIYTDSQIFWRQLHEQTDASAQIMSWHPFMDAVSQLEFEIDVNPLENQRLRTHSAFEELRSAFRLVLDAVSGSQGDVRAQVEAFVASIRKASAAALDVLSKDKPTQDTRFRRHIQLSIPSSGFARRAVQRLALSFGREEFAKEVPMALYVTNRK